MWGEHVEYFPLLFQTFLLKDEWAQDDIFRLFHALDTAVESTKRMTLAPLSSYMIRFLKLLSKKEITLRSLFEVATIFKNIGK